MNNRGLAEKISHDFMVNAPGLEIEEIVSVAYQGLINAALAFDESLATPGEERGHFGGYARTRIRGAILDWQRSEDFLQRTLRADLKVLISHGYIVGGRVDTTKLAKRSGLTVQRVETVIRAASADPTSTDALQDSEAVLAHPDANVESSAFASNMLAAVAAVISKLPMDQQVVLSMHYYQGIDLAQIAQLTDSNIALVRQRHSEAIAEVYAVMRQQAEQA